MVHCCTVHIALGQRCFYNQGAECWGAESRLSQSEKLYFYFNVFKTFNVNKIETSFIHLMIVMIICVFVFIRLLFLLELWCVSPSCRCVFTWFWGYVPASVILCQQQLDQLQGWNSSTVEPAVLLFWCDTDRWKRGVAGHPSRVLV